MKAGADGLALHQFQYLLLIQQIYISLFLIKYLQSLALKDEDVKPAFNRIHQPEECDSQYRQLWRCHPLKGTVSRKKYSLISFLTRFFSYTAYAGYRTITLGEFFKHCGVRYTFLKRVLQ
jgi:hypothetical protein